VNSRREESFQRCTRLEHEVCEAEYRNLPQLGAQETLAFLWPPPYAVPFSATSLLVAAQKSGFTPAVGRSCSAMLKSKKVISGPSILEK
jgi:hypothetical protein